MRFEILGPVRAFRDEGELALGPGKQRMVLAVLLINANQPVSTTRIIDAVWGHEPPENGANVVQKYISGLRKVLEPDRSPRAEARLLLRTEAGYLLRVEPGCLDADVFHERVRQARSARVQGRAAESSAHLRSALAMWRADALADATGAVVEGAALRLGEDRASAWEALADAELEQGHHEHLVPELFRLVSEFPSRERLHYQLVLALYRCCRQVDALAAFRDARTLLREEFGVEPGEELRELHQAILRADPALVLQQSSALSAPLAPTAPTTQPTNPFMTPPMSPSWAPPAAPSEAPPLAPSGSPVMAPSMAPPRDVPMGTWPASGQIWPSTASWSGPPYAAWPAPGPAPRPGRRWRWLIRAVMIAIPLASFGMASWVAIALAAAVRRSRVLAAASLGYLALIVFAFAAIDTSSDETTGLLDELGVLSMLVAWFGGALHAALIDLFSARNAAEIRAAAGLGRDL